MKRVAGAIQPRLPYSARWIPARMPIGVLMSVATRTMTTLP